MATEAALATLNHVWGILEPLGHPMAVMGGISLAAWSHIRATRDVDLLIAVDRASVGPMLDTLRAHGCRTKRVPPLVTVDDHCFVQFLYTPRGEFYDVQFDLLLAESELQKSSLNFFPGGLANHLRQSGIGVDRWGAIADPDFR